jgi:hypothetical protein
MATVKEEIVTTASPAYVWDAIRDIGALHTRLVVGFIVDTRLEPGARIVTFHNGMVVREPIVTIDAHERRLVWTAESDRLEHYNASVQVFDHEEGSRVVWMTDLLPDAAVEWVHPLTRDGMAAMKRTLDAAGG